MEGATVTPQLFGIIPTGSPLIIIPTTTPTPTSYIFNIPLPPAPCKPFTHLTVFMLPGVSLPPSTAAAVYLSLPQAPTDFKFLGAIGPCKESAVFKITGLGESSPETGTNSVVGTSLESVAEIDMDAPEEIASNISTTTFSASEILVGISIEPAEVVAAQMTSLQVASAARKSTSINNNHSTNGSCQALVTLNKPRPDILLLAQRIIKDAFNFLSSYSSIGTNGEMVPLKAFEDWWRKFESKVKRDPEFLEKVDTTQ